MLRIGFKRSLKEIEKMKEQLLRMRIGRVAKSGRRIREFLPVAVFAQLEVTRKQRSEKTAQSSEGGEESLASGIELRL